MRRLVAVRVTGLLGRFDHAFSFDADWPFLILHGPNGIGKTKLLELVAATLRGSFSRVERMPFEELRLLFDDESELVVGRFGQPPLPEIGGATPSRLSVVLSGVERRPMRWEPTGFESRLPSHFLRDLDEMLPVERVDRETWFDLPSSEYLSLADVLDRYHDSLPDQLVSETERPPELLRTFLRDVPVHLIETQRLLRFDPRRRARPSPSMQQATVEEFAQDLVRRLGETLAQNSRTSQELDQSFPRRLLSGQALPAEATDEQIRARYSEQNVLRTRLAEIAVLEAAPDLPLPERDLEVWERHVLWTYLEDTEKKLATFQTLLDRLRLLREIVNSHFLFKELLIDSERGFRFRTDRGEDIGPALLSSGEQHELVLAYDLLFNARENSLVLIDEPEISLHVAWQQAFLDDISQIADLTSIRFIVATHSPQIIHKWWSRAVALYQDEAESI